MIAVHNRPIYTEIYSKVDDFTPETNSVYILGTSVEQRSSYDVQWEYKATNKGVNFIRITEQERSSFTVMDNKIAKKVALRSDKQLDLFWNQINAPTYIDITGLSHHIWAPLIKSAIRKHIPLKCIYIEPSDYRIKLDPIEGEIYDLSERISGIAPIPGFVSLLNTNDENVCFIPLVGFEGTRLAYLIEQVQPPGGKIFPVVGVPGFLPHYPFQTYHGNQLPFIQHKAWKNIRFAMANCPFSLYYILEDIAAKFPQDLLKIAPIGTKPHALGAILYSIAYHNQVELVYDHPIRKASRTTGTDKLLVYHLSAFLT